MATRRVAACVLTGFLGSGKTTLLKGLLQRDPGRERIAVLVNEIGDIGIDGRVLTGFDYVENVVEVASGCVCCSIDEYRFDLAMDELLRRVDPTLVVLETSGVADPAPTLERLRRCGLGIDAVVTVVDARAWGLAWRLSGVARRQVAAADFLVVSKADLVSDRALGRVRRGLARSNPRALLLQGAGESDFAGSELLLATSAARSARRAAPGTGAAEERSGGVVRAGGGAAPPAGGTGGHLIEERMESFSWTTPEPVRRADLEDVLRRLPANVLRAKGFVRGPDEDRAWLFQVVCGRVEWAAVADAGAIPAGGQGVFIGPGVLEVRDEVTRSLDAGTSRSRPSRDPA